MLVHSITESYFLSINAAKNRMVRLLKINKFDEKVFNFVAYSSSLTASWAKKGLYLKDIQHFREIPVIFDSKKRNYTMDVILLRKSIEEDV